MPKLYNARQAIDLCMLTLLLGREAGNQPREPMLAVGCSVRNRVSQRFRGNDWETVIEAKWQYTSLEGPQTDPNLRKYPNLAVEPWELCLECAELVYNGIYPDPTDGAVMYFDKSLDYNPPVWANDGEFVKTVDVGAFHFFRKA